MAYTVFMKHGRRKRPALTYHGARGFEAYATKKEAKKVFKMFKKQMTKKYKRGAKKAKVTFVVGKIK